MAGELETLLEEMKGQGMGAAVIRMDGVVVHSTLALNDVSASLISSITNITKAMMEKMDDQQAELEITFDTALYLIVPGKENVFLAMLKSREEKKKALEYAKRALPYI